MLLKSATSVHASSMKMKPCGCLESTVFFLPSKDALNLDFVTEEIMAFLGLHHPPSPSMELTCPFHSYIQISLNIKNQQN